MAFFNGIVTLNDLKNMAEESRGKILGELLPFMAYEYGPQYVRKLWKQSGCKWEQFVDGDVNQFLDRNVSELLNNVYKINILYFYYFCIFN